MDQAGNSESLDAALARVFAQPDYLEAGLRAGNYLPALRLLSHPYPEVEIRFQEALRGAGISADVKDLLNLRDLMVWTFREARSLYWVGCAMRWLEEGFPLDRRLVAAIDEAIQNKWGTQAQRHAAFRIVRRWEKAHAGDAPN